MVLKKIKKEGDKSTPKGKFRLKYVLYRSDRIKRITTKLKKKIIRKKWAGVTIPKRKNIIN